MEDIKGKRLNKLLDATLFNHCETINLVDEASLCTAMFKCLVGGELDGKFLCPKLDGVLPEERQRALDIAKKYAYLCFYEGNINYWEDSIDGYNPNIPAELISEGILDNYNFLVELAHEKDEKAVAELTNIVSEYMATESSVVEYLRNSFGNDKLLKEVLANTSEVYKELLPSRKRVLYEYPQGTLYKEYPNDDFTIIPKEQLISKIGAFSFNDKVTDMDTLSEVVDSIGDNVFKSVIRDIYLEYLEDNKQEKKGNHR